LGEKLIREGMMKDRRKEPRGRVRKDEGGGRGGEEVRVG
jgi:hypothetical protein